MTDVDHCFTLRKPCVASLRTDRHQIGITDRHHWNAQYLEVIDASCGFTAVRDDDELSPIGRLHLRVAPLVSALSKQYAIGILGLHFRLMFERLPGPVGQFLFEKVCDQILDHGSHPDGQAWRRLFALIPLLTALPNDGPSLLDLATCGDRLSRVERSMHFRVDDAGTPRWVFSFAFNQPVICSVAALDGEVETAVACALVACFLKSFEADIQEEMIGHLNVMRREVHVAIGSFTSLPDDMVQEIGPVLEGNAFTVSRQTDPAASHPILVVLQAGVTGSWMPGTGIGSSLQTLLATILSEIAFSLFKGEIERDVLHPKVRLLVRRTIS